VRDGWAIRTEQFDCGTYWGVAVQSDQPIADKARRFAVRTMPGLSDPEARAQAEPILDEWIDREGWDRRKREL
jgi:hypothetical protein